MWISESGSISGFGTGGLGDGYGMGEGGGEAIGDVGLSELDNIPDGTQCPSDIIPGGSNKEEYPGI